MENQVSKLNHTKFSLQVWKAVKIKNECRNSKYKNTGAQEILL